MTKKPSRFLKKVAKKIVKKFHPYCQKIPSLALLINQYSDNSIGLVDRYKNSQGIKFKVYPHYLDFIRGNNIVRINRKHIVYGGDIVSSFDYYFSAVLPIYLSGFNLVDYSTPRYHDVVGYDRYPIFFPSFSEPLVTTNQYLSFANLKRDEIVIDLGAYSGMTSIMYKDIVGAGGTVVAVDADDDNMIAIHKNLANYEKATKSKIEILHAAAWNHNDGIEFSTEGNMGSSAASIAGNDRGLVKKVPSFTLSAIAQKFNLPRIDFIKCDIEGAEAVIFDDEDFFRKFKPKIIVETHVVNYEETTNKVMSDLEKYGYKFKRVHQTGVTLPLIECYPTQS